MPHTIGEPVLEIIELRGETLPRGASLTLRRGEILGIAGIVGSGRTELLRAVYGLDPVRAGTVKIGTRSWHARRRRSASPGRRLAERGPQGGGAGAGAADCRQRHAEPARLAGSLPRSRLATAAARRARAARRAVPRPGQPVGELSGGNQQKVALARLFHQDADVLLLDEPTRGVDVGSKAEIYRLIGAAAERKACWS